MASETSGEVALTFNATSPGRLRPAAGSGPFASEQPVRVVLELLDHQRVAQCGDIAQRLAAGDVLEQPPHDLARAGLGQIVGGLVAGAPPFSRPAGTPRLSDRAPACSSRSRNPCHKYPSYTSQEVLSFSSKTSLPG